jgi:hypothetical protein
MEAIALLKQSPLPVSLVGVVCCSPVQTAFLLHIKPQPYERHTSRDKRRPLHCSLTQKEIQRKAFLFLTTQFYRIVDGSLWMDRGVRNSKESRTLAQESILESQIRIKNH